MVKITGRTIMAPAAAATMAVILFTYTRSSIASARSNAKTEDARGGLKSPRRSIIVDIEEANAGKKD